MINKTETVYLLVMVFLASVMAPNFLLAKETSITVSALSRGAKFIGSSMDGARITIEDAETGEVLDRGITTGSTGNTDRIMREKHGRNRVLSTPGSARYTTTLDLTKPRRLKISAYGPLSHEDDANTATVTQKVLPGSDLTGGDGIRLQIQGFVVDFTAVNMTRRATDSVKVDVRADVMMMCGCPIEPNGLWDATDYRLRLEVLNDGEIVEATSLDYAGSPSKFTGTLEVEKNRCDKLRISAYDPVTANVGYETVSCE